MSNYQTARTATFKGLNRAPYISDGEMRSMKNLSSDAFPFLTTRKGRKPYTFTTYIPSPEGEAYQDIERLPVPCMEELGKVYRYTGIGLVPGAFYEFYEGEWKKTEILFSSSVQNYGKGVDDLIDGYTIKITITTSETTLAEFLNKDGVLVKYTGNDTESFVNDKIYRYVADARYFWEQGNYANYDVKASIMPEASKGLFGRKYYYSGETNEQFTKGKYYICTVSLEGRWEQIEGFTPVTQLPLSGDSVRWCGEGDWTKGAYYNVCEDNDVKFYCPCDAAETAISISYFPEVESEIIGTTYLYDGPVVGEFAKCISDGSDGYKWEQIEHPDVERIVTLKDYLDNYDGCGMTKLLEIAVLNGRLTALFRDGENIAKLYHNRKLYDGIKSLSEESGKKLAVVGNRLIVGESGNYLHEKDGEVAFFSSAGAFSYSVEMVRRKYQSAALSGDYVEPTAEGKASTGKAEFELWSPIKLEKNYVPGENLKELAEALSVAGTGFCVYGGRDVSSVKQYLKVESVTFEPKKFMAGSSVGKEYADRLYIVADGVTEDFSWYEKGKTDILTFKSTDPHYYDVAAWKKRLWGYEKNVLHGTAADIFNDDGVVDWITGDNTYTESISQPIWQGGNITGIATLREALVLFKEDSLTLVTGNYPAIMSSSTMACHGLSAENRRSVAVANESVYYLSYNGVYRFSGGIPECISKDAKITGTDAVGASDGNKYWLSLLEDDGKYALYVYDIPLGLWHKEDDVHIISFVMIDGDMYGATETEIYNLNAQRTNEEWEAEFWYDEGTHRKKKYNGFHLRGKAGLSEVLIKADDGEWQAIHWSEDKLDFKFPPIECEELSIKIKGKGICEIKSLDRDFEVI